MVVILIFLILGGCVVAGWINGLIQYSKLPKPPAELSLKECRQYYCDMLWQQEADRLCNKKRSCEQ